jgi:GntR family transcriptional regulator
MHYSSIRQLVLGTWGRREDVSPARFAPLYRWLADTLRSDITTGIYQPGDALPTELELMRRHDLSSTTVRRAVHDLVREGWIYRQAGKGTFVKRSKLGERLTRLTSFAEEMQGRNLTPGFRLVRAENVVPPPEAARALKLASHEKAFLIERIQLADGEPIAVAEGYWAPDVGALLSQQDLTKVHLYPTLEHVLYVPLVEADESISADVADAEKARLLGVTRHSPLLVRRRSTYSTAMRPLEHTITYYRADRYEYQIRLARNL